MLPVLLFAFLNPPVGHLGAHPLCVTQGGLGQLLNESKSKMEKLIPKSYLQPRIWEVRWFVLKKIKSITPKKVSFYCCQLPGIW